METYPEGLATAVPDPMAKERWEKEQLMNANEPEKQQAELVYLLDRMTTQCKWVVGLSENLNEKVTRLIGMKNDKPRAESAEVKGSGHNNCFLSEANHRMMLTDSALQRLNDTLQRLDGIV